MRKALSILLFTCFALHLHAVDVDYRLGARAAWIMPDGKVDKMTQQQGKWLGPAYSADFSVTFRPDWRALQQWNGAGVGLGFTYWHLPHDLLGQAFAPYAYMDIPLVKRSHFVLGLRPGIGAAFMTKTYQNTVPEGHLYQDLNNANQSIGSVTNLYFPEMLYMDFPIAKGWSVGIAGGWYHISNGSLRQPNSGYNLFAAELALRYSPTQSPIANNQSPIANSQSPIAHRQSPIANSQSPIANTPSPIICTDFVSQMPLAYALADLVISRAGASSISELCLLGKPSILVPSPNVAEDHQTHNAMALVKKQAAVLVKDNNAHSELIATALQLIADDQQLQELHTHILTLALPDSARMIAAEVIQLAQKK